MFCFRMCHSWQCRTKTKLNYSHLLHFLHLYIDVELKLIHVCSCCHGHLNHIRQWLKMKNATIRSRLVAQHLKQSANESTKTWPPVATSSKIVKCKKKWKANSFRCGVFGMCFVGHQVLQTCSISMHNWISTSNCWIIDTLCWDLLLTSTRFKSVFAAVFFWHTDTDCYRGE